MLFEIYTRVCVGLPVETEAARTLRDEFHTSLGLSADAPVAEVHARLLDDAPKHKRNEADRVRYERAFGEFVDKRWDVDCAIGGLTDGGVDPQRGYLFVGVRIEDMEDVARDDMPALAGRPQWLRKGDLTMGSDLAHKLGDHHRKVFVHAARMYQRANKMILTDAQKRLKALPVVRQREVDWALVRWLVPVKG